MRSTLSLAICFACLLAMIYPAFAASEQKRSAAPICLKDKKGKCRPRIKSNRGQQYTLGLPKSNKDGRTHRRLAAPVK